MPDTTHADTTADWQSWTDESMLRMVADAVPALLACYTLPELRCVFANTGYAAAHGFTVEGIIGRTAQDIVGDDAWADVQVNARRVASGERVQYTRRLSPPGRDSCMVEVTLTPHLRPGGQQVVLVLVNDITHHWLSEQAVLLSEERMRKFSLATEEAIVFHRDGRVVDMNDAVTRLMGYTLPEVQGRGILGFVSEEYRAQAEEYVLAGREHLYEATVLHKDGRRIPVEIVGKNMPEPGGDYRIAVLRDITARKQAQARLEFMSQHDTLTQLPNRRHLMAQLGKTLDTAQRRHARAAVLFLDLDHFKTVNDSLGHQAGDLLLCEMARRMLGTVRTSDLVARVGGDQFAVVLPDIHNRGDAATVADKLLADMRAVFHVDGTPLSLSPSIGISVFPEDGRGADELMRRADAAMHAAKNSGRGNRQFYAPGMEVRATEILQQERLLRDAIFAGAFELHYQPQVRVDDGSLVGFEALVRWKHPERGLVGPADFIGIAESRGLIAPIGRWVMHEACRQLKAWHDAGLHAVPVAVNLSALEFRQRDVAREIANVLLQTGLEPRFLEIEITESVLMQDADQARETLGALRALGVGISIDDFGTGYSSLAYLKRYPIDKLKIDRSFVMDTPGSDDDVAIVTAIVQLGRSLQLRTVAEGVETPEQLALLRQLGCDLAQGYGISRPMDGARARRWMQDLPA
ncbi:bifunctional diguanylate cyclase/phosphodiesterase [Acidovorax sp. Leaf160]|uniref:putative bifunctional diguanylate cyclase/phosphodiesterase n=1 Tax=Acidovorax sp. Leaf160 TaxID=1736280 RepID=UPI0006F9D107|nr:bifunctional diguanylate cyclase/phosphodiesterase [Acidovorax sp. Leaf160]KQR63072.1 diguanylate cyclase [Acidovorax sp. Leaf160]